MASQRTRCACKTGHVWEKVQETATHIIKQCLWCKGKLWQARRV